ncbi:hypothetical protein [Streptomyces bohaiensis]|uniref:SHOCT domain-containing protein n=1 Tax=Streptomyces bohaiensis TaxID=1431344 RepID=A0ABX1CE26_9ACTN|nr:hypothetical protein [Streptomyces bohaiensis]NJQ16571.1 hypothetical protein [Streptomyces bohaiensis]
MAKQSDEYGPRSPDYGLSYESDSVSAEKPEYGRRSPDYGLSYSPDPWDDADTVPDEWEWQSNTFEDRNFADINEAWLERSFREGHITREEFANLKRRDI